MAWFSHRTIKAPSVRGSNAAAEAALTPAPFPRCTIVAAAVRPRGKCKNKRNEPSTH